MQHQLATSQQSRPARALNRVTTAADKRILVVDDDSDTRRLIGAWLDYAGLPHVDAEDAEAALRVLDSHQISVVLCDRTMPGHDGLWLIAQIRERFPHVPVILATGDNGISLRITSQPGVLGYLLKPFDEGSLIVAVNDAIVWHRVAGTRAR